MRPADDRRPTDGEHDCGADVAAYALGALDADEVAAFEHHLAGCVICRDELTAFRAVVDVLPMSAPAMAAPRRVKRRVMAAVHGEAQPGPARRRSRWPRLVVASPRLAGAMATVLVAVIVAGALVLPGGGASVRVIDAQVIGQPGQAQLRVTGDRGELIVKHLAAPPAGHIYEVWLARPGHKPQPTNALFSTRQGAGDVEVPGSLKGVNLVMVTPEPAGGSTVPTHAAVIQAALS